MRYICFLIFIDDVFWTVLQIMNIGSGKLVVGMKSRDYLTILPRSKSFELAIIW